MFLGREQDRLACCSWYLTPARRGLGCSTALFVVVHARRTRCSECSTTTDLWSKMYYRGGCECISPLGVCSVCVCVCVLSVCAWWWTWCIGLSLTCRTTEVWLKLPESLSFLVYMLFAFVLLTRLLSCGEALLPGRFFLHFFYALFICLYVIHIFILS